MQRVTAGAHPLQAGRPFSQHKTGFELEAMCQSPQGLQRHVGDRAAIDTDGVVMTDPLDLPTSHIIGIAELDNHTDCGERGQNSIDSGAIGVGTDATDDVVRAEVATTSVAEYPQHRPSLGCRP